MLASGQYSTPFSLATMPGGRLTSIRLTSWLPSSRMKSTWNGVNWPAVMLCGAAL